jgi:hypothetical protein
VGARRNASRRALEHALPVAAKPLLILASPHGQKARASLNGSSPCARSTRGNPERRDRSVRFGAMLKASETKNPA